MESISLRAIRVDRGLTQSDVAELMGVSKRTIVSWESGNVHVKPHIMYALAYLYKVDHECLRVPHK